MNRIIATSLANWRTTVAGLGLITNGLIHLGFAIKSGSVSEHDTQDTVISILGGIGLIAAGDAGKSGALQDLTDQVGQIKSAVVSGNTDLLKKSEPVPIKTNNDLSSGPTQ